MSRLSRARFAWSLWAVLSLCYPVDIFAHEIRPAYFEIEQSEDARLVTILWKQPISGAYAATLRPRLSSGWLDREANTATSTASFLMTQWNVVAPHEPLHGQRLTIEGLEHTITDVMVHVRFADGNTLTQLVTPEHPSLALREPGVSTLATTAYLRLGIIHILSGLDHLLYIAGLMLLVSGVGRLIAVITAFTVAHSITLAATVLQLLDVPSAPIEFLISLSIVYVAVEILHSRTGRPGLATRFPWMIAFVFGLLHGFGFAGALKGIGLPPDAIPAALFLFNLGIEAGQLAFVLAVLAASMMLKTLGPRACAFIPRFSPYVIGTVASSWCYERATQLF